MRSLLLMPAVFTAGLAVTVAGAAVTATARPAAAGPATATCTFWAGSAAGSTADRCGVSPASSKPAVGTLQSTTAGQLTSPPGAAGTPYAYILGYAGPPGIIPAQRFDVSAA